MGRECKYYANFTSRGQKEIWNDILKKELSNKAGVMYRDEHWIWTEWQKGKDKELTQMFKMNQCFGLQYTVFSHL